MPDIFRRFGHKSEDPHLASVPHRPCLRSTKTTSRDICGLRQGAYGDQGPNERQGHQSIATQTKVPGSRWTCQAGATLDDSGATGFQRCFRTDQFGFCKSSLSFLSNKLICLFLKSSHLLWFLLSFKWHVVPLCPGVGVPKRLAPLPLHSLRCGVCVMECTILSPAERFGEATEGCEGCDGLQQPPTAGQFHSGKNVVWRRLIYKSIIMTHTVYIDIVIKVFTCWSTVCIVYVYFFLYTYDI